MIYMFICTYTIIMFQNVGHIAKNILRILFYYYVHIPMSYLLSIVSERLQVRFIFLLFIKRHYLTTFNSVKYKLKYITCM